MGMRCEPQMEQMECLELEWWREVRLDLVNLVSQVMGPQACPHLESTLLEGRGELEGVFTPRALKYREQWPCTGSCHHFIPSPY